MDTISNSRKLSKEETAELYATRTATPEQLLVLAQKCGIESELENDTVYITNGSAMSWNPQANLAQNHVLLAAVIVKGDCKLFYDDGVNEYFIYRYVPGSEYGPPIAHQHDLHDTVFDAAMNLWFPE